ncbi:uncharacterized protein LOC111137416 isoform X2 [Crassostrea virginica]
MKSARVSPEVLLMTAGPTFQSENSITIANTSQDEIKFKVRFSNDKDFSSDPIIGNIPANSKQSVKVNYNPIESQQVTDTCKFQIHVIRLSDGIVDNGPSTFSAAAKSVEKETFSIVFPIPEMDDDFFRTPKASIEVGVPRDI